MQEILGDLKSFTESIKPEMIQTIQPRAKFKRGKRIFLYSIVTAVLLILLIAGGLHFLAGRRQVIDSIAVLPLKNLSGDPKQEYFVDGMTEALITDLGKIEALRVISRTSAIHYKNTNKPLSQVAKELNADAVVEGSVMCVGEKVRITAQLIKAQPEHHLWSETFEHVLSDILTLQSKVAQTIANEISVKLTPTEQKRLSTTRPVNPEAYEFYALGRYLLNNGSLQDQKMRLVYFQMAFEEDPNYALAYSGLAGSYNNLGNYGFHPPHEVSPKAKAAALKALEFDDELAEAHTELAFVKMNYDWDWAGAESEFKRAIELNPGAVRPHLLYAWYLSALGRFSEGLARMEQALRLHPFSRSLNINYGWHLHVARQYDRAITQFRKTIEMDSTFSFSHQFFGLVYEQKRMYKEAIAEFQRALSLSEYTRGSTLAALGHAYAISGDTGEAKRILNDLLEQSKQRYISSYDMAVFYAGLGEKDEAFTWLEKAYEQRDGWLAGWLKVDPRFDNLHDDQRFIELLKKIGLDK
ncbi:MAG: tetratricopeptide repeat protein [Candidatus Hodarchaeota archaeon]